MKSLRKKILLPLVLLVTVLLLAFVVLQSDILAFGAMQYAGKEQAGTWDDDPQNWQRAFGEAQPAGVTVIRSRFWKSDHFPEEFIYYFEIAATPEWKASYLKSHALVTVPAATASSFRQSTGTPNTPDWFAPEPVERYETWDVPGYSGSLWIDRASGHIYLFGAQL